MMKTLLTTLPLALLTSAATAQGFATDLEAGLQMEFGLPTGTVVSTDDPAEALAGFGAVTYGFTETGTVDVEGLPVEQGFSFSLAEPAANTFDVAARFAPPADAFVLGDRGLAVVYVRGQAADGTAPDVNIYVERNGEPFTSFGGQPAVAVTDSFQRYFVPFEIVPEETAATVIEEAGVILTTQWGTKAQSGTLAAPVFINYGQDIAIDSLPSGFAVGMTTDTTTQDSTSSAYQPTEALRGVTVAPNPARVSWSLANLPAGVDYRLLDIAGRAVRTGVTPAGTLELDAAALPRGVYSLNLLGGAVRLVRE